MPRKILASCEALLRFVGFRHGPARFQMRGDEREGEIRRGLNFHLGETALTRKRRPSSRKTSLVCGRRATMGSLLNTATWMLVSSPPTCSQYGKSRSVGLERRRAIPERVGAAHFFQREHVGIHAPRCFRGLWPWPRRIWRADAIPSADPDNFPRCKWRRGRCRRQKMWNKTRQEN